MAFITILRMSWNWYRNILLLVYLDMISRRFFSQEVHNGEGFTTAADWWAFGILVFELMTGQCLFESLEEIRKGSLAECPRLRRNLQIFQQQDRTHEPECSHVFLRETGYQDITSHLHAFLICSKLKTKLKSKSRPFLHMNVRSTCLMGFFPCQ